MSMPIEKFTMDQFAQMMRETKPYLIALQEMVEDTNFGTVEVRLHVRKGEVEKMDCIREKTWLRPKVGHDMNGFVVEEMRIEKKSI